MLLLMLILMLLMLMLMLMLMVWHDMICYDVKIIGDWSNPWKYMFIFLRGNWDQSYTFYWCVCRDNGNMWISVGFVNNLKVMCIGPYVMCVEPLRACASSTWCVVTHLWICDQLKTCGAVQALAAVIRGLHAVMLPKACRPGWQRRGRAKERGRGEVERRGGGTLQKLGEGQMFHRTGTSQDRAGTGKFINHKRWLSRRWQII